MQTAKNCARFLMLDAVVFGLLAATFWPEYPVVSALWIAVLIVTASISLWAKDRG